MLHVIPIHHFIIGYDPMPADDWIYCVVYFNSVSVEASSWLYIYNSEVM